MDQEAAYENGKRSEGSQPESDERQTCDGDGALAPQSVRVVFRSLQFIKPEIRALFLEYGNRIGRALIALHKPLFGGRNFVGIK